MLHLLFYVLLTRIVVPLAYAQTLPAPVTSGYTREDLDRCKYFD